MNPAIEHVWVCEYSQNRLDWTILAACLSRTGAREEIRFSKNIMKMYNPGIPPRHYRIRKYRP